MSTRRDRAARDAARKALTRALELHADHLAAAIGTRRLKPHGRALLRIATDAAVTNKRIATALGCSERGAQRVIAALIAAGLVRSAGNGKARKLSITEAVGALCDTPKTPPKTAGSADIFRRRDLQNGSAAIGGEVVVVDPRHPVVVGGPTALTPVSRRCSHDPVRSAHLRLPFQRDGALCLEAAKPTPDNAAPLPNAGVLIPKKRCSRCGSVQPFAAFARDRGRSDGRQVWCRCCAKAYQDRRRAERTLEQRARLAAQQAAWRRANPERNRELQRRWRVRRRFQPSAAGLL